MPVLTLITPAKTVLLVDDYPTGRMVGAMMIEHLGYTVITASTGQEAINAVRSSRVPFVAVLMDVQMHDMDGFEATRAIRVIEQEKGYSNTIIAVTAHALAGDRERCLDAGMNDYISKPIHPDILAQKLELLASQQS
jgi:CheY-like chemotaxis protein